MNFDFIFNPTVFLINLLHLHMFKKNRLNTGATKYNFLVENMQYMSFTHIEVPR